MESQHHCKTIRDVLQKAIIYLKFTDCFGSNVNALYDLAFMLSVGGKTIQLDLELDSNKDIMYVLDMVIKQEGFSSLEQNGSKLNNIQVLCLELDAKLQ